MADLALATPTSLVCFQENSSGPLHLESCVNAIISVSHVYYIILEG